MKNNKTSKIYVLFLAIFLFTDPFILFRVLFGNDVAVFFSISFIFTFIVIYFRSNFYSLRKNISKTNIILSGLVLFSFWSVLVRFYACVALTDIVIYVRFVISMFIIFLHFKRVETTSLLVKSYIVAGVLHLVSILPFLGFIQERLVQYTAYEAGEYAIGIFSKRATGFFAAPGYLIVYSTGLIMIGVNKIKKGNAGWLLALLALLLGLATLNRSFLIIVFLFVLILLLKFKKKSINLTFKLIPVLFFLGVIFSNKIYSFFESYNQYLNQRFEKQSLTDNDRIYGPTGFLEAVNAVDRYPFFGNPVSLNGGSLQVWNGTMYIQPHNSLLLFFTFYGLILGIPFLIILLRLLFISIYRLLHNGGFYNEFSLGFLALIIICMIEPLFESSMFGFFFLGVLMTLNVKYRRI